MSRTYRQRQRAERAAATRQRVVEATLALHEEVGPARTTFAEIARRAGVSRQTVYALFPDEPAIFAACSGLFEERHPLPDLRPLGLEDALVALYGHYRANARLLEKIERDARLLPSVAAELGGFWALLDELSGHLAEEAGADSHRRVAIRLALDFWTWRRLDQEGLDPAAAAALAVRLVRCAD